MISLTTTDYSRYQGPSQEWEEFVSKTPVPPGGLAPGQTPSQLRAATNALRVAISEADLKKTSHLERVLIRDYSIPTLDNQQISVRTYQPKYTPTETALPVYLFFHGGGHLFGTIETEDASCCRIVATYQHGIIVVNVNYRHTPEFKHPTQIDDAWNAFQWLTSHIDELGGDRNQVVVGGISAGAGLVASILLRLQEQQEQKLDLTIKGQLLFIPWLLHPDSNSSTASPTSSYTQNSDAPVLPVKLLRLFTDLLGAEDPEDPYLNIPSAADEILREMPKAAFVVAGRDMLRDEGLGYAERLTGIGVPTKVHVFPGLPHGFRRFGELPSSARWDVLVVETLDWCLNGDSESTFHVEGGGDGI